MTSSHEELNSVQAIRAENRIEFDKTRKEMRFKITTIQRGGLENFQPRSYSPTNLNSMAAALKKKKDVDRDFLVELSQALAESEQNCVTFCGIDGTLQSLCSFLTGIAYKYMR